MVKRQCILGRLIAIFLLSIGLVSVFIVSPSSPAHAQTLETVLGRVQDYLKQQLGRDFVLVSYTYAIQTWPDASLGCPEPGRTYVQEEVRGYKWTLTIFQDDTVYELHSNLEGTLVVLCTPIDRSLTINYRQYQNNEFLIDYPETWQAVPDAATNSVLFVPDGVKTCDNPGMRVTYRPALGNADTLLNESIQAAGVVQAVGTRSPIGTTGNGLTVLYQTACETIIHQYRASGIVVPASGSGFLVEQWSPLTVYESWGGVYLDILEGFQPFGLSLTGNQPPAENLVTGYPFAHVFVEDVYLGVFGELPGTQMTFGNVPLRRGLSFSADGEFFAYIDRDTISNADRLEISAGVTRSRIIAVGVAPKFPPAWSAQNSTIAYLVTPANADLTAPTVAYELYTVVGTGENRELRGTLTINQNCPTPENPYLVEQLYWRETGTNGDAPILVWLPDGRFLYSMGCDGMGLAIWSPIDNTVQVLGEDLHRPALTPDRLTAAALDGLGQLQKIDLLTGTLAPISITETPDQFAWSLDGTKLYYTSLSPMEVLEINAPEVQDRALQFLNRFPYTSQLNLIGLNQLDIASTVSTSLWQGQGYAIGRIVPAPTDAGVVFSLVPSDRAYVDAFIQNLDVTELRLRLPETQIYWIAANSTEAKRVLVSSQPVFAPRIPTWQASAQPQ